MKMIFEAGAVDKAASMIDQSESAELAECSNFDI